MNTRRNFLKQSAGAALASGAMFMGFPKLANAANRYKIKIFNTSMKGWQTNTHTGVVTPEWRTVISGHRLVVEGTSNANTIANNLVDSIEDRRDQVYDATGGYPPQVTVQVFLTPGLPVTPQAEQADMYYSPGMPRFELLNSSGQPTGNTRVYPDAQIAMAPIIQRIITPAVLAPGPAAVYDAQIRLYMGIANSYLITAMMGLGAVLWGRQGTPMRSDVDFGIDYENSPNRTFMPGIQDTNPGGLDRLTPGPGAAADDRNTDYIPFEPSFPIWQTLNPGGGGGSCYGNPPICFD